MERTVIIPLDEYLMLKELKDNLTKTLKEKYECVLESSTLSSSFRIWINSKNLDAHQALITELNFINTEFELYKKEHPDPLIFQPYKRKWNIITSFFDKEK